MYVLFIFMYVRTYVGMSYVYNIFIVLQVSTDILVTVDQLTNAPADTLGESQQSANTSGRYVRTYKAVVLNI